ncbi:Rossmann-like and DUF2520 domain-containing protein [Rhodoferax sp.]|uniref:Rossmann-like and DUF2520 domain-containing protein n=1 Tax=Rhodoferax sp. TaxID=50421 RepID=UPI00260F29A5|nr:Rossmann-like and DUF2520 domain-containing protein [Rhodoferax sp.]MDD2923727.1 DUF2520 domain-containing protein [Rhodoferax sp.]
MKTLNIIGGGRVGQTLGRLFQTAGLFQVQATLTRSRASAEHAVEFIGAGQACTSLAAMPAADVWMLAVSDQQISVVAAELARLAPARPAALAFHCSGALDSTELSPLRQCGWSVASAHCLLSFARPELALAQFAGTPCALEGDAAALDLLDAVFTVVGGQCFRLAAQHKLRYHAAAVFATNFLPVLQDLAEQLWQHSGMPDALAQQMRERLLRHAVNNIVALGPKAALTGPAARGDLSLVAAQGQSVTQWNADAGQAYQALSRLAGKLTHS